MRDRRLPGVPLVILLLALGSVACPSGTADGQVLALGMPAPDIAGAQWINSAPLTMSGLRGRVVLVEFWTYG